MIAEIQVLPTPAGTPDDRHAHVEAAIAVIQASGLHHEVGPLGTTLEGAPDAVWAVLRAAQEATLAAGAERVVTVLKLLQATDDGGPSMADLVRKFRP